ncbi:MAG: hypothetical protein IH914_05895 [candidate division Zixibacteria bacterium]|nr:hypothetical protein [candidate division Zixibacteria bacterium]
MMKPSLDKAKHQLLRIFAEMPPVLMQKDFKGILEKYRGDLNLPSTLRPDAFIRYCCLLMKFKRAEFKFPSRVEVRFYRPETPLLLLVNSIKKGAYFSHYTALQIHDLTEQIPKTIFLNKEQSIKPKPAGSLEQANLNQAFSRNQRISRNIATYQGTDICVLSGKNTNNLAVVSFSITEESSIMVTNVERTLIDIVVRPYYSGGVYEVLKAFRLASEKVSINALVSTLKKLDYIYPYHQAIGFYLTRAECYSDKQIRLLKKLPMQYDFYLFHGIKQKDYSEEWRLFFPKGF